MNAEQQALVEIRSLIEKLEHDPTIYKGDTLAAIKAVAFDHELMLRPLFIGCDIYGSQEAA